MNARELALAVVRDVFPPADSRLPQRGAQEALDYRAERANATPAQRAFATELAYGAIKMRRALDWQLAPFVGDRLATLPPAVSEILRLGAYEIVYTDPDVHATVFEFVNLTKRHAHRGLADLVNAVLRRLLREPRGVPECSDFPSDIEYLATRYSLPDWLVRRWREAFGERLEAVCSGVNGPAQAALVAGSEAGVGEVAAELASAGVATRRSAFAPDALPIESGAALARRLEREAGARWWLQSESSAAVVAALNPQPGEAILDLCSGRGNKALQIAGRLGGEGNLTCVERDPRKVEVLTARCAAAGRAVAIVAGDATDPQLAAGRFDRVLVDAPCSGIGVVGRQPEARWRKRSDDATRLSTVQAALLARAGSALAEGGVLTYAVCSNDPRETTGVVDAFLREAPFERGLVPHALAAFQTPAGDVEIPPGLDGRDGFYIARLERR